MLRGMFLVRRGACSFSRTFCFVPGTKILHNVENSAAPRRIVTRQTDIGTKKKKRSCKAAAATAVRKA